MIYKTQLWQLIEKAAKAKNKTEFWQKLGKNPDSMRGNKQARENLKEDLISFACLIRAIEADKCPNCTEIIPDSEMKVEKEGFFTCPLCSTVIYDYQHL